MGLDIHFFRVKKADIKDNLTYEELKAKSEYVLYSRSDWQLHTAITADCKNADNDISIYINHNMIEKYLTNKVIDKNIMKIRDMVMKVCTSMHISVIDLLLFSFIFSILIFLIL